MRFTPDVDVPEPLVTAAIDGSLVLFVGAGASLNAPSSLPLYEGLAKKLADLNGETYDSKYPADTNLGRLIDRLPIVREQAKNIIGSSESLPNDSHTAIVRLASHSATTRLVTTNFDEHLMNAAALAGIELGDRFNGPALPLARDFSGLVHLHGSVSRPTSELVLTDGDFGRAYLTDGWARRFVHELFLQHVVLFIGYSHDDTVMKYLARGLPTTTSRFALTDVPDHPKWADLRITPVSYPSDDDHASLTHLLNSWADRLEMGQLDHSSRVKAIVQGGPPKKPVDDDYIRDAITSPVGVRAFVEVARGRDWLAWAEQQPAFLDLFKAGNFGSDSSSQLARWFREFYLVDDSSADLAMGVIARLGPVASHELMRELARGAYYLRSSNAALSVKLSTIISAALRTDDVVPEENWLFLHGAPIDSASVMPFLRRAVRPRLVLSENRPWLIAEDAETSPSIAAKIAWSSVQADVERMWKAAQSDFASVSVSVLHTFEQSLRDGYELLQRFDPDSTWDSWSFGRSAIEAHEQDNMRNFEDTLIDALRDASVLLCASDRSIVPRWLNDPFALFRRLAIHALAEDSHLGSDEKIDLLLSNDGHIYDRHLKHEVFRLLGIVAPSLDGHHRSRLLQRIVEGPPDFDPVTDQRLHRRCIFDLLEWLTRFVKGWPELITAIEVIRAQEPDMGTREHPDFDHYLTSGVWEGKLPFEVDDFVEMVQTRGAAAALGELLSRDYTERNFDQPEWDDALSLIRQVVESQPDIGVELLMAADGDQQTDIVSAILRGWAANNLGDAQLARLTDHVEPLIENVDSVRAIAEFVLGAVDEKVESRTPGQLARLDYLTTGLWNRYAAALQHQESDDWTSIGLNTWPGFIARYWINRIRLRWRASQDDWDGLTVNERTMLSTMLEMTSGGGQGPLAVIAGEVYFLYAADAAFTSTAVFPHFNGSVDDRAVQAWTSFLYHPRLDDRMLDDGFWDLLVSASTTVVVDIGQNVEGQYWNTLASIVIASSASSVDGSHLITKLARESDAGLATFFDALAFLLGEIEAVDVTRVWEGWLRESFRQRTLLLPGALSESEKTAWGDLSFRCGPVLTEALQLAAVIPGPLGSQTKFQDLSDEQTKENADLIARIVKDRTVLTSNPDWHLAHELEEVVRKLKALNVDPTVLRALVEAAISIGIHHAGQWIGG